MKWIKSYYDYLIALIEKESDDIDIQKETKNALRILRQYPEQYKEYVENKRNGKSLLELGISEKDIRFLVRKLLTTRQIKKGAIIVETVWDLDENLPDMFDSEDVIAAIDEIPLEDLLTKKGALKTRNAIFERCMLEVILQGKVDEIALRNEVAKRFNTFYSYGMLVLNQPLEYVDVICFINHDAPIVGLTNVLASETGIHTTERLVDLINSHRVTILPSDNPLKVLIRTNEELKAENEKLKAKNEAKKQAQKEKQSKKAREREQKRAEKLAKLKAASDERFEEYRNNQNKNNDADHSFVNESMNEDQHS